MIVKLLQYDSRPDDTGVPLVYPASDAGALQKTASNSVLPELIQYLGGLEEPDEHHARCLITALSAHDTFGPNKNGDSFFREDLLKENDYGTVKGEKIMCPMHESFHHFARPYKFHINKETSPSYGKVLKSFFNPAMDRVELLAEVDRRLAPDTAHAIENYLPLTTSMGFKAAYDVCLICGNVAKTRAQYCHHAGREMLRVYPDGRQACVRNPQGRFFDISFLRAGNNPGDPADVTSRAVSVGALPKDMGQPVEAEMQREDGTGEPVAPNPVELSADLAKTAGVTVQDEIMVIPQKTADDKSAVINKQFPADIEFGPDEIEQMRAEAEAIRDAEPRVSRKLLHDLALRMGLAKTASTFGVLGIDLRWDEAQYVALVAGGMPKTARNLWDAKTVLYTEDALIGEPCTLSFDEADMKVAAVLAQSPTLLAQRSYSFANIPLRTRCVPDDGLGYIDKEASIYGPNPFTGSIQPVNRINSLVDSAEREISEQAKEGPGRVVAMLIGSLISARWMPGRERALRYLIRNPDAAERILGGESIPGLPIESLRKRHMLRKMPENSGMPERVMITAPMGMYMRGVDPALANHGGMADKVAQLEKGAGILSVALSSDPLMVAVARAAVRESLDARYTVKAARAVDPLLSADDLVYFYGLEALHASFVPR